MHVWSQVWLSPLHLPVLRPKPDLGAVPFSRRNRPAMDARGRCTSGMGDSMRTGSPASRGYLRIRFSLFDTIWALGSPIIALAIREAQIVSTDGSVYCLISLAFSLVAYSAFRLHDGVLRFFNVKDAWNVVRAVACAEVMTCVLLFTLTRLENIPRSTTSDSCTDSVRRAHRCPGACPDE